MNVYTVPISGQLVIPAETSDEARDVAVAIADSLGVELFKIIRSENRAALGGRISVGRPSGEMEVCTKTLDRMQSQLSIPV